MPIFTTLRDPRHRSHAAAAGNEASFSIVKYPSNLRPHGIFYEDAIAAARGVVVIELNISLVFHTPCQKLNAITVASSTIVWQYDRQMSSLTRNEPHYLNHYCVVVYIIENGVIH